jgi:hypothetical protein
LAVLSLMILRPAAATAEGAIVHDLLCNPHYVVFSAIRVR